MDFKKYLNAVAYIAESDIEDDCKEMRSELEKMDKELTDLKELIGECKPYLDRIVDSHIVSTLANTDSLVGKYKNDVDIILNKIKEMTICQQLVGKSFLKS